MADGFTVLFGHGALTDEFFFLKSAEGEMQQLHFMFAVAAGATHGQMQTQADALKERQLPFQSIRGQSSGQCA